MPEKKKEDPEAKKKNKKKDSALRRFILRATGADKVVGGMEGKTPAEVEAERKKQRDERKKK